MIKTIQTFTEIVSNTFVQQSVKYNFSLVTKKRYKMKNMFYCHANQICDGLQTLGLLFLSGGRGEEGASTMGSSMGLFFFFVKRPAALALFDVISTTGSVRIFPASPLLHRRTSAKGAKHGRKHKELYATEKLRIKLFYR